MDLQFNNKRALNDQRTGDTYATKIVFLDLINIQSRNFRINVFSFKEYLLSKTVIQANILVIQIENNPICKYTTITG